MADLATVRTEIKTWERSFKDLNGRAPTVDDIKQNSAIADKYKQYKKLSKGAAPSNAPQKVKSSTLRSTPPRSTRRNDPPSLLLSRARIVQPTAPLSTFNPFSPQKKQKGKEKEKNVTDRLKESRSNLFGKSNPISRARRRSLSPDPFPLIQPTQPPSSASSSNFSLPLPLAPTTAVSRARKRLRGEPVSPSPNKEKRRRVTSQTTILFPRLTLDAPSSDDGDDFAEAETSFVDNSPVKASTSGKFFARLFEETVGPPDRLVQGHLRLDRDGVDLLKPIQKTTKGSGRTNSVARKTNTSKPTTELADVALQYLQPRKASKLSSSLIDKNGDRVKVEASSSRSSTKRPVSDGETDDINQQPAPRSRSPLIPPSPPPSTAYTSFNRQGKNASTVKGANKSRKKAKIDEEKATDDSDELELTAKLKIVTRNAMRPQHAVAGTEDDDSDPVLGYARFAAPRATEPNAIQQEEGHVDIDLPDKLRRVLALQSAASNEVLEEDRLVKGLIYGRRVIHYDPSKGGEIWDVGEDHHIASDQDGNKYTDAEDEWEGEPVPWEVGEL